MALFAELTRSSASAFASPTTVFCCASSRPISAMYFLRSLSISASVLFSRFLTCWRMTATWDSVSLSTLATL